MSEHKIIFAAVVELADTKDLKSFADWHTSSILVSSTRTGCATYWALKYFWMDEFAGFILRDGAAW